MPKRRRERDRPKAAHDAPFNPNKRVLLSYESDEEVEDEDIVDAPEKQALMDRPVAAYTEDGPVEREAQAKSAAEAMMPDQMQDPGEAQQEDDEVLDEDPEAPHANEASLWTRGGVRKNEYTGQWAALGSLAYQYEDGEEDEEFESEEEEAMAYLRGVRTERQSMPEFFAAQKSSSYSEIYNSDTGDTRGYFEDGAYIAAPIVGPALPESAKALVEPQEAFAIALKARFLEQRRQLHIKPSTESLAKLSEKHPTSLPKNSSEAYSCWLRALRTTSPLPAQVRAMQERGALRVLGLIRSRFLVREQDIPANLSAWIWSLLARLDDVGIMDSDQIASLREFGKRAVLVQLSFRDPDAAAQLEELAVAEGGLDAPRKTKLDSRNVNGNAREDISALKLEADASASGTTDQGKVDDHDARRTNTLATLDTIIVLVGEVFRQRDLLEFRQSWTEETEPSGEVNESLPRHANESAENA